MALVNTNAVTVIGAALACVVLKDAMFRDEMLTFAAAGELKDGTILARDTLSGKLVPFVKGGTGGAEEPKAVLTYDVKVDAAGDVAIRAAIVGKFRKQRLIILADGDDTNVDAAVIDGLRQVGLTPIDVHETTIL
jgi:hypothetical protein